MSQSLHTIHGRSRSRQRGVTLTTLDLSHILSLGLAAAQRLDPTVTEVNAGQRTLARGVSPGGKVYVLGTEGVGEEVGPDNPFVVELYASRPRSFDVLPFATVTLSHDEVESIATGPAVDLADHIRTFGGRLEENFAIFHEALTA